MNIKKYLFIIYINLNIIYTHFKKIKIWIRKTKSIKDTKSYIKDKIINERMSNNLLNQLCVERNIPLYRKNSRTGRIVKRKLRRDDYISYARKNISLEYIIKFSDRNNLHIGNIIREFNQTKDTVMKTHYSSIEEVNRKIFTLKRSILDYDTTHRVDYTNRDVYEFDEYDNIFSKLAYDIGNFKPSHKHPREQLYRAELFTFLKNNGYDDCIEEFQTGDIRPDLVVNGNIAIELKGPTTYEGLKSIFHKIPLYSETYKFIIIVLFDMRVKKDKYYRWFNNIKREHHGRRRIYIVTPDI